MNITQFLKDPQYFKRKYGYNSFLTNGLQQLPKLTRQINCNFDFYLPHFYSEKANM